MIPRRLSVLALAGLASLAIAAPGCSKKPEAASRDADAATAPVPEPAGLCAELSIARPAAFWATARQSVGGKAAMLPASASMLVGAALGLSPLATEQLDLASPIVGAAALEGPEIVVVVGVRTKPGIDAASALTTGESAAFARKPPSPTGVVVLAPKAGAGAEDLVVGASGGVVLVARHEAELVRVGGFVASTLASRKAPEEDAVVTLRGEGLRELGSGALRKLWGGFRASWEADDRAMREKHGGSAPDFGEPTAALADLDSRIDKLARIVGDVREARVALRVDAKGARLDARLAPGSTSGPAAAEIAKMSVGDLGPLLDLPAACPVALVTRERADARVAAASDQAKAIGDLLGGRMRDADRARVTEALGAWAKARGDVLAAGVLLDGDARALVVAGPASSGEAVDAALPGLARLVEVPAIDAPIANFVGRLVPKPRASTDGALHVLGFEHGPPRARLGAAERATNAKREGRETWELVWSSDGGALRAGFGRGARAALEATLASSRARKLADDPDVAASLAHLGNDASFALLLQPMRVLAALSGRRPESLPAAPVLVAYGRREAGLWAEIDVSSLVLREWANARD